MRGRFNHYSTTCPTAETRTKMTRTFALFVLLSSPLAAANFTTAGAGGNINAGATYVGGVAPTSTDTITITEGATVTWNISSTFAGITVGSGSGGFASTAKLVISPGVTAVATGNVCHVFNGGTRTPFYFYLTMQAGSTLDLRAATLGTCGGNYDADAVFQTNGNAGSHVTLTSTSGGGSFSQNGGSSNGLALALHYTDIINWGDASTYAISAFGSPYPGGVTATLDHITTTNCGAVRFYGVDAGDVVNVGPWQQMSSAAGYAFDWQNLTGGTINFDSVYVAPASIYFTALSAPSWNGVSVSRSMSRPPLANFSGGLVWANFTKNIVFNTGTGSSEQNFLALGDFVNNYVFGYSESINRHWLLTVPKSSTEFFDVNYNIFGDGSGTNGGDTGDIIGQSQSDTVVRSSKISHNLVLPAANFLTSQSQLCSPDGAIYARPQVTHNTAYVGFGGLFLLNEAATEPTGYVTQFHGNVMVKQGPLGVATLDGEANSHNTCVLDQLVLANTGYNARIDLTPTVPSITCATNQGGGYIGQWSVPMPPASDITKDPAFVDPSRNIETFASAYFSDTATRGAWLTGTAYAVGDVVSQTNPYYYGGVTILYRCISAHTSATATKPSATGAIAEGANWRTVWELQTMKRGRDALYAGTTYTDATLGVTNVSFPELLMAWVRYGFRPTTAAYHNADALDGGTDIGSEPVLLQGSGPGMSRLRSGRSQPSGKTQ
jgi:hypothetical protein